MIPLPLIDIVFEVIFRRRIPGAVAAVRRAEVVPEVRRELGSAIDGPLTLRGCLSVFFAAVRYIVKRIWRKIIYILAVKDATTALTEYWHRAFLIDHMVRAGHLSPKVNTNLAVRVFKQTLRESDPSPLMGLSRLMIANVHHVLGLLVRARRMGAAEVTRSLGELMSTQWQPAQASLVETANRYNQRYAAEVARMAAVSNRENTPE